MPSISVVVPVYNVERYVSMCLDSLRGQTFADIEIICVDDGSTDRSAMIARAHASLDSRIQVISKPNGGLSSARNAGIDAAQGEYVMFVDSDDYLERGACAKVFQLLDESEADVAVFGANAVPGAVSNDWLNENLSPRDATYEGFSPGLLFKENTHPFSWRVAARKSLLDGEHIRFDEAIRYGEDQVFAFELFPLSRRTVLSSDKLYNYRLSRKDSLMSSRWSSLEKIMTEHVRIVDRILDVWTRRGFEELCPEELLTWMIGFIMPGLLDVGGEERVRFCKRFGEVLSEKFWNLSDVASRCPKGTQRLVNLLVSGGDSDFGSRFTAQSVLYLEGRGAFARVSFGKLTAPIIRVASRVFPPSSAKQSYFLDRIFDGVMENASAEQALTGSLLLLRQEYELNRRCVAVNDDFGECQND
ncbi:MULTISPECIES: glycosyltransferase family 2 protein [unclassified Adlercreutzia]|uniref:glycosyltransferase family 2 protein n=1 Tax=unclassified Adlercreutzia TaxID=2636013 RepID=UPI0013EC43CA|nr:MULTISPECIES: glycosyltransferase family 2 protein [unclassified Adlercreutzia]